MSVETRPEITSFINNWFGKPKEQVAEELASYALETRRIPDSYYFMIDKDGDLFHPSAQVKVKDLVRRDSFVGEAEGRAFDAIESWVRQNDWGVIAWVSPPYPGIYPICKMIISEIERTSVGKRLHNRAILFDFDQERCLKFAQNLASFSKNNPLFKNLDQVRTTPLILDTQAGEWTSILEELINDPILWKDIREGKDREAKRETIIMAQMVLPRLFGAAGGPTDGEKMLLEMLGERAGSCPVILVKTAFQLFAENSALLGIRSSLELDQYGSLEFECSKCKRTNRRTYGQLIKNCQHCRADIGC